MRSTGQFEAWVLGDVVACIMRDCIFAMKTQNLVLMLEYASYIFELCIIYTCVSI